jgi:hypothetical protein
MRCHALRCIWLAFNRREEAQLGKAKGVTVSWFLWVCEERRTCLRCIPAGAIGNGRAGFRGGVVRRGSASFANVLAHDRKSGVKDGAEGLSDFLEKNVGFGAGGYFGAAGLVAPGGG